MSTPQEQSAAVARLTGALERQAEELRSVRSHLGLAAQESARLLRPDDVATRLAKSRAWVYRSQHALGGFRIGGQLRSESDSIDPYLERCRTGAPSRPTVKAAGPLLPIGTNRRVGGGHDAPPQAR
jgi:hypothetical protein